MRKQNSGGGVSRLQKSAQRFLDVISERSEYISVRGKKTQEILSDFGVDNTWVTGCPSLLRFEENQSLPDTISTCHKQRIVLQSTRHAPNSKVFREAKSHQVRLQIYRYAFRNRMPLLLQSEMPDIPIIWNAAGYECESEHVGFLERVYSGDIESVKSYLKENAMIFWNVPDWLSGLKGFDAVIGTRIHGAISSVLAGLPTVLLVSDERTLELAKVTRLPYTDVRDIERFDDATLASLVESIDMSGFKRNFSQYRDNFCEFFRSNEVAFYL